MPENLNIPTEQTALRIAKALETLAENDTRWLDRVYPVGSIYQTFSAENPSVTFGGGTWERIGGRFLLAADDGKYAVGGIGGEENVTLTEAQLPQLSPKVATQFASQTVTFGEPFADTPGTIAVDAKARGAIGGAAMQVYFGGGQPHTNMPPYVVVYVWHRTA